MPNNLNAWNGKPGSLSSSVSVTEVGWGQIDAISALSLLRALNKYARVCPPLSWGACSAHSAGPRLHLSFGFWRIYFRKYIYWPPAGLDTWHRFVRAARRRLDLTGLTGFRMTWCSASNCRTGLASLFYYTAGHCRMYITSMYISRLSCCWRRIEKIVLEQCLKEDSSCVE